MSANTPGPRRTAGHMFRPLVIDGPSLYEDASVFRFNVDSVEKWAECPLSSSSGLWGPVTLSYLPEFLEQEPCALPPACLR